MPKHLTEGKKSINGASLWLCHCSLTNQSGHKSMNGNFDHKQLSTESRHLVLITSLDKSEIPWMMHSSRKVIDLTAVLNFTGSKMWELV